MSAELIVALPVAVLCIWAWVAVAPQTADEQQAEDAKQQARW